MPDEMIHLYFREAETGRIITHFLYPKKLWGVLEFDAKMHNLTTEEHFCNILREYCDRPLKEHDVIEQETSKDATNAQDAEKS